MPHEHVAEPERADGEQPEAAAPTPQEPVGFETDPRQAEVDPRSTIPPPVDAPD